MMINFTAGTARFNFRIVGAALHRFPDSRQGTAASGQALDSRPSHVLLHRAEQDDYWALPGGRAELLEPSIETLRREMQEELEVTVQIGRLLWVVENFFVLDGYDYHELALYYAMKLPQGCPLLDRPGPYLGYSDSGTSLIFQWFPLDQLATLPLYPTFLRAGLQDLPLTTQHVIHTDE